MATMFKYILEYLKQNYGLIIVVGMLAFIIVIFIKVRSDYSSTPGVIIKHDTTVVMRYEKITDTVVKWHERVLYSHPKSDTVYIQKVDSVLLRSAPYKDLMLTLKKSKDKLTVFSLNEKDSVLKEYTFSNISGNFTAISAYNNVHVETTSFEWAGLSGGPGAKYYPASEIVEYFVSAASGITFRRLTLSASAEYNFSNKNFYIGTNLNYKLIK